MDEKIKQTIEEMELVMHNSFGCRYFSTKDMILNNDRFFNREATALYNAGYRKESDTAREIFEKLLGYIGSQQQFCIVDEEHKTLIDCDKLFNFVGNLAKEKYGVDLGE